MSERPEPTRPTDHLPPADERDPGDDRTTARHYPGDDGAHPDARDVMSDATAAEPDEPKRHGVDKLPPGLQ